MNHKRRQKIEAASALLNQAVELLTEARDEEQEAFENMPESLQSGDKGDKAQEAISELDAAISGIEDAQACLETAVS